MAQLSLAYTHHQPGRPSLPLAPTPILLADGSRLVARSLGPEERSAVEAVFEGLSEESRRAYFAGPKPKLSEHDLAVLTAVDHRDHEALVALERSGRPVAIVRYIRDADDSKVAEVAFMVSDKWQSRGVGTVLTQILASRARAQRIERFRATVLASNERARLLLRRVGRVVGFAYGGGVREYVIELGRGGT
jgi:RimJ/RimL family protein N-acetyltransferase